MMTTMSKKIQSIVWITKDIPDSLLDTIAEYRRVNSAENMGWHLLISSNSRKDIEGISYIDKELLYNKIVTATKDTVPEDVIEFALFSKDFLNKIDTIDTGTHRNAALLATIGQRIIFSDDDVLCQFYQIKNNHRKLKIDHKDVKTFYFENKNILDLAIDYSTESNLTNIITAHQKLLSAKADDDQTSVLATMTGVHGESIADTPIHLLRQVHYLTDEDLYRSAKINKLVLSYSKDYLVRKKPHFVSMFSGLNNEAMLPPFFPIARNQDGIFAATLMACLPHSLIGQVPWVVKHEHFPPRTYKESDISNYSFKLNTLIISLLNHYTKNSQTKTDASTKHGYKEVGKFLENFSKISDSDFIKFMQNYLSDNIERITLELGKYLVADNNYSKEWQKDIKKYLTNAQKYKKTEQFCIPQELHNGNRNLKENTVLTKHLINMYGKLLYYWPDIIKSIKNNTNK